MGSIQKSQVAPNDYFPNPIQKITHCEWFEIAVKFHPSMQNLNGELKEKEIFQIFFCLPQGILRKENIENSTYYFSKAFYF